MVRAVTLPVRGPYFSTQKRPAYAISTSTVLHRRAFHLGSRHLYMRGDPLVIKNFLGFFLNGA